MLLLASLCTFGFAFTFTLWLTGMGTASGEAAMARLGRIREGEATPAGTAVQGGGLRKRSSVNLAGFTLVSSNLLSKWTAQLERGGLSINAREYFILRTVVSLVIMAMLYTFIPVPVLALAGAPLGFFVVGFWLKMRISRRQRKLEAQLIELLQMVSSGLRAGFGLIQALESSGDQLPSPLSIEIRRTLRDTAMGASIDQAMLALNERIGSSDFDIVITAILIQRQVGGNLAEILDNVAHTMRERERIRGEIRTLTSQQRLTGYVVGGIPIGLGFIFFLMQPDFMGLLFTDPLGRIMLGAAVVLQILGFFVISRIVNIEV